MSHMPPNPYADTGELSEPLPPPRSRGGNALGIAGFVTSLVAICTGFVLSPLALLLSLIALRRPPRGLAITGTIIGSVGTVILAVGIAVLSSSLGQTMLNAGQAAAVIIEHHEQHHVLPDQQQGDTLVDQFDDGWGTPLRYERLDEQRYEIISAGEDRQFGTDADVRFEFSIPEPAQNESSESPTPQSGATQRMGGQG